MAKKKKKANPFKGRLGTGQRFKACVSKMKKNPKVTDPEGVCAKVGRKAHGKAKMAKMAAKGRKRSRK